MSPSSPNSSTRHLRAARIGLAMLLLAVSTWASAEIRLNLFEMESAVGPEKTFIPVKDALSIDTDGKPHLNLHPDHDADHKKLIDILKPGMPIDLESSRDDIAAVIAGFPAPCLNAKDKTGLIISVMVSPVEGLDSFVPGVKDKRRIRALDLGGCLADDPPECFYDAAQTGAVDFDIGMFKGISAACRDATLEALRRGALYSDAVYAAHPELKKPAAPPPKP